MPMKVGTSNVVRLYKQGYVYRTGLTGGIPVEEDPAGKACTLNDVVVYNGSFYRCEQVEVTEMKDASNSMMHRRTTLTFNPNGGSGSSSQTRTWDVENVTTPSNPTRSGYNFLGWATTSSASSPNVTFPFAAPQNDTTYYAVWQVGTPQTVAPTLYSQTGSKPPYAISVRARNDDSSGSATILMDIDVSPPTTNRGLIAYNSYTSYLSATVPGVPVAVYATAQVSGELKSTVTSIYVG